MLTAMMLGLALSALIAAAAAWQVARGSRRAALPVRAARSGPVGDDRSRAGGR